MKNLTLFNKYIQIPGQDAVNRHVKTHQSNKHSKVQYPLKQDALTNINFCDMLIQSLVQTGND